MFNSAIHRGFDHCPVVYFVLTRKNGEGAPVLVLETPDNAEAQSKLRELEEEDHASIHRVETYTVIPEGYRG